MLPRDGLKTKDWRLLGVDPDSRLLQNIDKSRVEEMRSAVIDEMRAIIEAMPQSRLNSILSVTWESEDEYKTDSEDDKKTEENNNLVNSVVIPNDKEQTQTDKYN